MAQHAFGRQQSEIFVQNTAHVLVRRHEPFHQHVGHRIAYHSHRGLDANSIIFFVYDRKLLRVDPVGHADFDNLLPVADQNSFDDTHVRSGVHGLERVRILGVSHCQLLPAPALNGPDDLIEFRYHDLPV